MNKNWRKAVCTKSEVNSKVKFLEGHYYFEKESDHEGMMEVIDENGTTVTFSMESYVKVFGGEGEKKLNRNEIMKIQTIFDGHWVELSKRELEKKKEIKEQFKDWEKNYKGKDLSTNSGMSRVNESYFTEELETCKKLSEALNPENWEKLGANEIGKRIRKFQEIL